MAGVIEIDEELIGDAEYVSFNIAYKGNNVDLTNEVSEVAERLNYIASGSLLLINENGELKVNYMLGFWNNNATSISLKQMHFTTSYYNHPIPKEQIGVGAIIKLEEGYQFRFIRLEIKPI